MNGSEEGTTSGMSPDFWKALTMDIWGTGVGCGENVSVGCGISNEGGPKWPIDPLPRFMKLGLHDLRMRKGWILCGAGIETKKRQVTEGDGTHPTLFGLGIGTNVPF